MTTQGVMLRQGRQKPEYRPIDSWAHASAEVRAFIEARDLTVSGATGPQWTGGTITDATGEAVAYVSYNGKVWDGPPSGEPALLYDPYGAAR